jgi:lipid A 3-O-deacylase
MINRVGWQHMLGVAAVLLSVAHLSPGRAESLTEARLKDPALRGAVGNSATGYQLSRDEMSAGFTVGAGLGSEVLGSTRTHDLALASLDCGRVFTDRLYEDRWFRGNWELLAELTGGAQLYPTHRYIFGLMPALRYNFATATRWIPFIDGGLGIAYTNIGPPDLATRFEFMVQAGAGTRYFLRKDTAVILQYRWLHLSNAGIREPNLGANTQMFVVGLSWFF